MPKLKRLSAAEVVSILRRFGFTVIDQSGSHLKLRRVGANGEKQTLIIPNHRQLDIGTCHATFRQATRYVSVEELRPFFYSE
jgi:predicted RNA binding protein YcfA (HicA-like mRNA interferase family)